MSKAFTSEENESSAPLLRPRRALAPGEKRYVTPEGQRMLQRALDALLAERARAAAAGRDTAELDERAKDLSRTLGELTVVEADPAQAGRVFFGAWVTLQDEDGNEVVYRLVGPDEADARAGLISVESPLARALLGKAQGEQAVVERPRGPAEYTIESVRYGS
jgi:transcription elongation factor GreB